MLSSANVCVVIFISISQLLFIATVISIAENSVIAHKATVSWKILQIKFTLTLTLTHVFRCQRHRDISDDRWLIPNNRCCQRLLHLVSFLDVVTIEQLVYCLDQQ